MENKKDEEILEIIRTVWPENDPADGHEMTLNDNQKLWIETIHTFTDLVIQLYLEKGTDPLEELMACTVAESLNYYLDEKGKTSGDVLFFFTIAQVYIRQLFTEYEKWCKSEGERWRSTEVRNGLTD